MGTVTSGKRRIFSRATRKINLDIFWLNDESLEDSADLPAPEIIVADIVADLEAALDTGSAYNW